jgi:parvulin-like peptidyl-prolyl isomerase
MLERGVELKIEVSDDEVSAAVKELRVQNRVEDEATFEQMLLSTGMTLKSLRARLRDTMIVNRVLSREVGNFPITEEELRQRLARDEELYREPEKVHLEHVVYPLAPDDKDRAEKEAAARRLVAAVRAGGDFLSLVKQETEAGLATGGDLGELVDTDLRDEIRLAVALLKPGEVSDPFLSLAGVHVVRVVERIPSKVKPFEAVVEELRQREMSDRYRDRMTGIVEDLKKRYVVEVHPELFQPPT